MNILSIIIIFGLLALIIIFCEIFTNAIENSGKEFKIKDGALGSIFAAVGTALPETVLPLIAVFGAYVSGSGADLGKDIGKGAVLGSPFLLSSLAFFVTGFWILILSLCKKRDLTINIDMDFYRRDLKFFSAAYTLGVLSAFIPARSVQIITGGILLCFYMFYAVRTVKKHCGEGDYECEGETKELLIAKIFKIRGSKILPILIQLFISITGLLISSYFFVESVKTVSATIGISAMIISLFLAPIATELPEMINAAVWSASKKDTLAISNITGAMVFQSCIPMSIGIFFTGWSFNTEALVNIFAVYTALAILYFGTLKVQKSFSALILLLSLIPYAGYVIFSILNIAG